MPATPVLVLAWPPRLVGTQLATVVQGSVEEITQCVAAAASTVVGSLIDNPAYGIPGQALLAGGVDASELAAEIIASEPRAAVALTVGQIIAAAQSVGVQVSAS